MKGYLIRETCRSFLFLFKTSTYKKKFKQWLQYGMMYQKQENFTKFWHEYKQPPKFRSRSKELLNNFQRRFLLLS